MITLQEQIDWIESLEKHGEGNKYDRAILDSLKELERYRNGKVHHSQWCKNCSNKKDLAEAREVLRKLVDYFNPENSNGFPYFNAILKQAEALAKEEEVNSGLCGSSKVNSGQLRSSV